MGITDIGVIIVEIVVEGLNSGSTQSIIHFSAHIPYSKSPGQELDY